MQIVLKVDTNSSSLLTPTGFILQFFPGLFSPQAKLELDKGAHIDMDEMEGLTGQPTKRRRDAWHQYLDSNLRREVLAGWKGPLPPSLFVASSNHIDGAASALTLGPGAHPSTTQALSIRSNARHLCQASDCVCTSSRRKRSQNSNHLKQITKT